jgi:hypothetical protein
MFFFGSPEQTARLYWEQAVAQQGPPFNEAPLEEMTEEDIRVAMAYVRMAWERAFHDEAPEDVIDFLVSQYDGLFERLATISEDFRAILGTSKHRWLGGYDPQNIRKYMILAGLASAT